MSKHTTPFREGDDPIAWFRCEIPGWVSVSERNGFTAFSSSYEVDGIEIWAPNPEELVERVRALERLIALAADRAGALAVGRRVAGRETATLSGGVPSGGGGSRASTPPATQSRTEILFGNAVAATEYAKSQGYTGDPCGTCGSMAMKRSGSCATCENCGSTSGCS